MSAHTDYQHISESFTCVALAGKILLYILKASSLECFLLPLNMSLDGPNTHCLFGQMRLDPEIRLWLEFRIYVFTKV